jgi:hypothetical protein
MKIVYRKGEFMTRFKLLKISAIVLGGALLFGLGVLFGKMNGSSQGLASPNQQSNVSLLSRITHPFKSIPNPAIDNALKSLRKMASAIDVGLNFQEYGKRILDLKFEVEEEIAKLPDSELKQEIKLCLQAYIDAATAWNETLRYDFLLTKYEPGKTLQQKYAIPPMDKSNETIDKNTTIQVIWKTARKHLDRSTELQNK